MQSAFLILESGERFQGKLPEWVSGDFFGEVVFNTGMVGYVEAMTDPSYRGQILTFTYPLIGNYGVPDVSEWESDSIHTAGVIVSTASSTFQHRNATSSFLDWCEKNQVPVLMDVDTRALAKTLSRNGVVAGVISTKEEPPKEFVDINKRHLVKEVSISKPKLIGEEGPIVVAVDCGMKKNIMRHLLELPIRILQVPFDYDFTNEEYDAVFISNGPGDPAMCKETVGILKKELNGDKPIFGICLGSQIMAQAIGAKTYKLPFGHRAQNHACIEEGAERCYLTSQNHGFAIDEESLPDDWQVMYRNLNDQTVQGIKHKTKPFFSVQFHPEAGPGPVDTAFLFEKFYKMIEEEVGK